MCFRSAKSNHIPEFVEWLKQTSLSLSLEQFPPNGMMNIRNTSLWNFYAKRASHDDITVELNMNFPFQLKLGKKGKTFRPFQTNHLIRCSFSPNYIFFNSLNYLIPWSPYTFFIVPSKKISNQVYLLIFEQTLKEVIA